MAQNPQHEDILACLTQLSVSDQIPRAARESSQALLERLTTPIVIGLFGLPGAGQRRMIDALLETQLLSGGLELPTTEVGPGTTEQVTAILADGATISSRGIVTADIIAQRPVFLSITSPRFIARNWQFLLVVSDNTQDDLSAGIRWGSDRVDIAIWCTNNWTPLEATVWETAPDSLRDHSILCVTKPSTVLPIDRSSFGSICLLGSDLSIASRRVSAQLDQMITDAVAQDQLVARFLFDRYANIISQPSEAVCSPPKDRVAEIDTVDVPQEARLDLEVLFRQLRRAAMALRRKLADQETSARDISQNIGEAINALVEQAFAFQSIDENYPGIQAALVEAQDLAVLLQAESGEKQATDSARLLLQLRTYMEIQLAA